MFSFGAAKTRFSSGRDRCTKQSFYEKKGVYARPFFSLVFSSKFTVYGLPNLNIMLLQSVTWLLSCFYNQLCDCSFLHVNLNNQQNQNPIEVTKQTWFLSVDLLSCRESELKMYADPGRVNPSKSDCGIVGSSGETCHMIGPLQKMILRKRVHFNVQITIN